MPPPGLLHPQILHLLVGAATLLGLPSAPTWGCYIVVLPNILQVSVPVRVSRLCQVSSVVQHDLVLLYPSSPCKLMGAAIPQK